MSRVVLTVFFSNSHFFCFFFLRFPYNRMIEMVGDSPKGSNVKGVISYQRRRLTVVSDSKFADGFHKQLSILGDEGDEHTITLNVVGTMQRKMNKRSLVCLFFCSPPVTTLCTLHGQNVTSMFIASCLIAIHFHAQVKKYAGVCKKGYAPYNPRKQNQDSIIMARDPETNCMLFAALDGHGELGDHVSQYIRYYNILTDLRCQLEMKCAYMLAQILLINTMVHCRDRLPKMLFAHKQFPHNVSSALANCIAVLDKEVNSGKHCDLPKLCFFYCFSQWRVLSHAAKPCSYLQRLTLSSAALPRLYARLSGTC